MLSEGLSRSEMAKRLVVAYRGAYEARYGKRSFVLAKTNVEDSTHYRLLWQAAEIMRDHDLRPCAWVAWAMDTFRQVQRDKGRDPNQTDPPFIFVFSGKRLHEKRWWFRNEMDGYLGGHPQVSPKHKEVLRRYNSYDQLWRRACRELEKRGTTRRFGPPVDLAEDVVEAFVQDIRRELCEEKFPDGWEHWYEEAKEANLDYAQKLKEMLAQGKFVWGAE